MLSRRLFVACGLCAVSEFAAIAVDGRPASAAGLTRTELKRTDGPAAGYETVAMLVEIDANFTIPRHTHPGIESTYVLEGSLLLQVDGQPERTYKAGEAFQVPPVTVHGGLAGASPVKLIGNYIVEKGKPLATLAT